MAKTTERTRIVFRFWDGDVIALLPDHIENNRWDVMCYQHIGQHGTADYGHIISQSRPATPEEYADLKHELEIVGYAVHPIKRASISKGIAAHIEGMRNTQN